MLPLARCDDLIVRELPDEMLVYEAHRPQAHRLNSTAAVIWRNCDGRKTMQDLVAIAGAALKIPATEDLVEIALDQLGKAGLLESGLARLPSEAQLFSRHSTLAKLGLAAAVPSVRLEAAPACAAAICV